MAPYCRSRPMARSALPPWPDAPRVLACHDVQRCATVRVCSFPSEPYDIKDCPATGHDHMGRVAPSRFGMGAPSVHPPFDRFGPSRRLGLVVVGGGTGSVGEYKSPLDPALSASPPPAGRAHSSSSPATTDTPSSYSSLFGYHGFVGCLQARALHRRRCARRRFGRRGDAGHEPPCELQRHGY